MRVALVWLLGKLYELYNRVKALRVVGDEVWKPDSVQEGWVKDAMLAKAYLVLVDRFTPRHEVEEQEAAGYHAELHAGVHASGYESPFIGVGSFDAGYSSEVNIGASVSGFDGIVAVGVVVFGEAG